MTDRPATKRKNPLSALLKGKTAAPLSILASAVVYSLGMMMTASGPRIPDMHRLYPVTRNRGVLYALWHGDHFPILWRYRNKTIGVITSQSRDGEVLTRVLRRLGYACFRGSSSRGGTRALMETAKAVRAGKSLAIAVDGPRGPRHSVKPGILSLAKLSGAPIIPVGAAFSRCIEFRSWDRYRLPLPGAEARIAIHQPLWIGADADSDAMNQVAHELAQRLAEVSDQAAEEVKRS